jgi:hypothetical protein
MSLSLLGISTITHYYDFLQDLRLEVITISPSIYKFIPYLGFTKRKWEKEFKNQLNVAMIVYPPSTTEKIIYRFSNPKKLWR